MEVHYKRIAFWGKLMGVIMMLTLPLMVLAGLVFLIGGGLDPLAGVLILVFYSALGIGTAWVGKNVYDAGANAKAYLANQTEENMDAVIEKYGDFLFSNVVYSVVAIVGGIPLMIFLTAVGVMTAGM